jgi:hypothetical protein
MYRYGIDPVRRTITLRVSGTLALEEAKKARQELVGNIDQFKDGEHIILADLRGMAPVSQEVAAILGEVIKYGRERGTALCVHLSDSSIMRLQAGRLAREADPKDKVTINVVSLDEADKVIDEHYPKLKGARK